MEQTLKHLKLISIGVLALTLATILELIAGIFFGSNDTAGAPENVVRITEIFVMVISGLLLLPQAYVGAKGLLIAENPDPSAKLHIILAIVLFAISALNLLSSGVGLLTKSETSGDSYKIFLYVLEASVYFDYIKAAKAVAKDN